jgi:YD repeat-containing protein
MAEKEFVAKIVADTTQADAAINKTADSLNNLADAENNVADASKNAGAALKNVGSEGAAGVENAEKAVKSLKGATELVAGSIAAGVGSLALFGAESEKLGEIEKKVQGAIAIALGVREAAEGAVELVQQRRFIQEKALQAATKVSTAVQAAYNAVVSANPIALIVLAIAGFITALVALKDKIKIVSDAFDFVNEKFQDFLEFLGLGVSEEEKAAAASKKLAEGKEKQYTRELALLKAKGASERDIYNKSKQIIEEQLKQLKKGTDEYKNAQNQLDILEAEFDAKEKERQDKADKEAADRRAKQRENAKKALIDKAESERQLAIQLEDDEKKRRELILKDELADIEVARQAALAQENLTAEAKKAINAKFDNDKLIAKDKANNDIAAIDKKAEDKAKADTEKAAADLKAFQDKAFSDELAAINNFYNTRENEIKSKLEQGLITQQEYDAQLQQLELTRLDNLLQATKDAGQSTVEIEKQILDAKIALKNKDAETTKQTEEAKRSAQKATLEAASQFLGAAASLAKEGSKEAKAFALAQIAADTAIALTNAQASAFSPASPDNQVTGGLAGVAKYITYAAIILSNVAKAKAILNNKGSGGGGATAGGTGAAGAGGTFTTPPPITTQGTFTPLLPQGTTTIGGGERGERVIKTYVLAGDVTDAQEAEAQINQKRKF